MGTAATGHREHTEHAHIHIHTQRERERQSKQSSSFLSDELKGVIREKGKRREEKYSHKGMTRKEGEREQLAL